MMFFNLISKSIIRFGLCVAISNGVLVHGALAQNAKLDLKLTSLGGFMRTAEVEPITFGAPDCSNASSTFCSGSAVAAVALEFPDQGSTMVRDLATNLVEASPFLRIQVASDKPRLTTPFDTANARVTVPDLKLDLETAGLTDVDGTEGSGFDLNISVNKTNSQPAMTAGLRKEDEKVKFSFQKSYAFLK